LAKRQGSGQIVMITAYPSIPSAVEAMRLGAYDYLEKRFQLDDLEAVVDRAILHGRRQDAACKLGAAVGAAPCLVGSSPAMQSLRACIAQVAPSAETVLITGESGTGKEVVARLLHALGPRGQRPLVEVNSAALSPQLAESELFGHAAGAFTGAVSDRPGRFELAHQATILLDEIGDMDAPLQAKLLRVLQERTFQRVGSSDTLRVDVIVLACTNRDLRKEVAAGRFREDLFFRLNVFPIEVPPLRTRREDVPELIDHFLALDAPGLNRGDVFASAALDLLQSYDWPGNVRELSNIVARCRILHRGEPFDALHIRPWLLDPKPEAGVTGPQRSGGPALPAGTSLREMERRLIETTLDHFGGHRRKTADALGIGLRTLTTKLKEYGHIDARI
ncbi:MAG: sigma-54-dependent Fis family transcriptional regulator, partial [Planctomycetia bacterium]|nr:sigma-54-dependent Fis family transcriptional regulator [Planctomycetia bacterium]